MPELPEVETMKRDLQKKILGLSIEDVFVYDDRVIKDLKAQKFKEKMKGKRIEAIERRGKSIIFTLYPSSFLVIQVKMTGYFVYGEHLKESQNLKETKVVFKLSNDKYLNYNDQRLFGWLIYTDKLDDVPYLCSLGPEPLNGDFRLDDFKGRKTPIKPLLMNQEFVAGIGNIYASEILFAAGINPRKQAKRLTEKEIKLLHKYTVGILTEAIRCRGTSMRNYRDADGNKGNFMNRIKVYGRENEKCVSCRSLIKRIVQSGRSTFFCGVCQR